MSATLEEHYSYLSDAVRTELYRQAIAQAIRPGDVVVDLGCGFGVLGLMCLEAGAARVWGIDRTDAVEIARESAARAGYADRYHCLRETSFRAVLPETADIVICDHVGYFGFDYGIIEAMGDARRRLLKPGGLVMPGRIKLQIAGVASQRLHDRAHGWATPGIPRQFHWLDDYGVNSKHALGLNRDEVTTTEATLGEIDLAADNPESFRFEAEIEAAVDGALDGLAGWFACTLSDRVSMTNSPLAPERINRDQAFLPFATPLDVMAGDRLRASIAVRHDVTTIAWTLRNLRTGQSRRQTTWKSQILSENDQLEAANRIPQATDAGKARMAILALVDGNRSAREIEDMVIAEYPTLLPSEVEIRRFVRSELARSTQ